MFLSRKEQPKMRQHDLTAYTGGFNLDAIESLPAVAKRGIRNEGALVIKRTVLSNLQEQGRAHITNTALENVGALTALEEHLCEIAPSGAERYRHIVDAYTMGAARTIGRW
jgi:hypothetical protein